jgi:hypothetical protein
VKDFEPIAAVVLAALGARQRVSACQRRSGLVAWLRAKAHKATFGTIGQGSPIHIWAIHFQTITGTRFQSVQASLPFMEVRHNGRGLLGHITAA